MHADRTGVRRLTQNPAPDGGAAWSPDGRKIALTSRRHRNFDVYLINAAARESKG
jgi:Tol biopolymer transport system component